MTTQIHTYFKEMCVGLTRQEVTQQCPEYLIDMAQKTQAKTFGCAIADIFTQTYTTETYSMSLTKKTTTTINSLF